MNSQGKYFKFWANGDNTTYLHGLNSGTRGTVINEALRLYADTSNMMQPTVANMRSAFLSNSLPINATANIGPSVTISGLAGSANNSIASPMLCPAGHLWMNGTKRCVNLKCEYGKIENQT